jgi:hypothetical protein
LKDSDTFFKECDVWKSKLPNKLIVGTEFETSITIKITELGLSDMLVKKTSVKWLNGINEKKVINLLNVEITNGIFKKILDNHG